MPVLRIDADDDMARLHGTFRAPWRQFDRLLAEGAPGDPVIVMTHGYRYRPSDPLHCPHRAILSDRTDGPAWLRALGFDGQPGEGLGVAFGWNGRGSLRQARDTALRAGRAMAQVIARAARQRPDRPVHLLVHSLGSEVALAALHRLDAGAVRRAIILTGASYRASAEAALATAAGQGAELVNITSRENDPFDFLFERLIAPSVPGDRAMGHGLAGPNAVTLQIDCPRTLACLDGLGLPVAGSRRRVCHWSAYTRPGALELYARLLRDAERLPLEMLRSGLPDRPAARWSRLLPMPALIHPLPFAAKQT